MLRIPLWKKLSTWIFILIMALVAMPNFMSPELRNDLPGWLPKKTMNLGLDLQGGSHLVLQVGVDATVARAYQNLEDEARDALAHAQGGRILFHNMGVDDKGLHVTVTSPAQADTAEAALRKALRNVSVARTGSTFQIAYFPLYLQQMRTNAVAQTLEVLRTRVDQFGVSEPVLQQQGDDQVIVELPGITDVERAKSVIGRTAQLSFHMVDEQAQQSASSHMRPPPGDAVFPMKADNGQAQGTIILKRRAALTGENLAGAEAGFDQFGNASVNISFDSRGTSKFARLTTDNVGKRMAIVLDGVVYSAPVLREPIMGGRAQITGSFTVQESRDLAMVLRAGALPAPVKVVEERSVGPTLGADSIHAGAFASALGFALVLLIMVLFYRGWGLAANMALICNIILIIGCMTLIGSTLTLPGIAGIALTIGMAVDSNILVFERIREEAARGLSPLMSMDQGFKSAFATILDANITTLVSALVLFGMGSGTIKGFALTLSIGVLSTIFTAVFVTRMFLAFWFFRFRPLQLPISE